MERVRVAVIGVGGFARTHLEAIEDLSRRGLMELTAVTIPLPWNPEYGEEERERELRVRGVRVYRHYRRMLEGEANLTDLVTVPVGIPHHAEMSIAALEAGFHVLCEKPAAGSVAEAVNMFAAQRHSGRILAVGFQHQLTPAIRRIRELTLERRFGRLRSASTVALWPRGDSYYRRNSWAGRLSVDGRPVYDSPVQNAASHFLQNMLYVSGAADRPRAPLSVYAENYRARSIESADTQYVRVATETGAVLHLCCSHAVNEHFDPVTEFLYERGRIVWRYDGETELFDRDAAGAEVRIGRIDNGTTIVHYLPFEDIVEAILGRTPIHGGIEKAIAHVRCVVAAFESSGGARDVPERHVDCLESSADTLRVIRDAAAVMRRCAEVGKGPGELDVAWGVRGRRVDLPAMVPV